MTVLAAWCSLALASCGQPLFDRANHQNDFHGVILDQDHRPVANADITLQVYIGGLWGGDGANSGGAGRSDTVTAVSNETGGFSLPDTMIKPFDIKAAAAGYLIDSLGLTTSFRDRKAVGCDASRPCVVRAWKLGAPSENRAIEEGRTLRGESFGIGDKTVLRVKIHLTIEEKSGARRLLKNPTLEDASKTDDWDLELSLANDSPDVGNAPFSFPERAPLPRGMAIRLRARAGGVCQADPVFPLMAKNEEFAPAVDLNWSDADMSHVDAFYKIFYRDEALGYLSFLSIHCKQYGDPDDGFNFHIRFFGPANRVVPHLGVINLSGAGDLEYFPEHLNKLADAEEASRRQRLIHSYQEKNLDSIRQTDPKLAKEIEDRMRAEGKVVPPR